MTDKPQKPPKTAPVPQPQPPKRVVWFACRANAKCEGKEATIVRQFGKPGSGSSTHYRCNTCQGTWVVNV